MIVLEENNVFGEESVTVRDSFVEGGIFGGSFSGGECFLGGSVLGESVLVESCFLDECFGVDNFYGRERFVEESVCGECIFRLEGVFLEGGDCFWREETVFF